LKSLVESIIGKLKNDPTYRLDENYSFRQLWYVVWYRFVQLCRGLFVRLSIHSRGMIFCGKRVTIEHGYQVYAGKSLILEEGVHLNALSERGIKLGDNVTIAKYAILTCTGVIANKGTGISIGHNSAVGAQSFIAGQGGVTIGNDVIMGAGVRIFSENHIYNDPAIVIRKQGETRKGVFIGDNCWIGAGSTILDGVHIASGCIVAAGSVVTRSLDENSIAAGVPARVIKHRLGNS
jgi:acetyltransferase-like isoleucine patch superfamily enzyme